MSCSDDSNNCIQPGDLFWGEVRKSKTRNEDTGVQLCERDGKVLVMHLRNDGLFARWTPLEAGDQLLTVNDRAVEGMSLEELNLVFETSKHVKVKAQRAQYGL